MTVKAVCVVTQLNVHPNNPMLFNAAVNYVTLGDISRGGTIGVDDIEPTGSGATVNSQIEEKLKAFLEGSGSVTFGPSDFVLLIPR